MKALRELFRFGIAGTVGFIVDSSVLYLLRPLLGLYYGRGVSFFVAVIATWLLNRNWTFSERRSSLHPGHEFSIYLILMLVGGTVNYAVYAWLVSIDQRVFVHPILGVAAGSLAGMLVNLLTSRCLLFRFNAG